MLRDLLAAIALFLVFEGILPFLSPPKWRELISSFILLNDRTVRRFGFICMLCGAALLVAVHHWFDS